MFYLLPYTQFTPQQFVFAVPSSTAYPSELDILPLDCSDPLDVLGHLCVDTVLPSPRTPFSPADHARHEPRVFVAGDVGATAVTLARVLGLVAVAGAEHGVGDLQAARVDAGLAIHEGHAELKQQGRLGAALADPAEAADHAVVLPHQHPLGEVALGQAGRQDVGREADGVLHLDERDVVVVRVGHVLAVHQHQVYLVAGFAMLVHVSVSLACDEQRLAGAERQEGRFSLMVMSY